MSNIFSGFVRKLRREEEISEAKKRIAEQERRIEELERQSTVRANPADTIWIFGTGRTGSTWLGRMMRDLKRHDLWAEPLVSYMLGHLYHERGNVWQDSKNFIFGGERDLWMPPLRRYILDAMAVKFPNLTMSPPRYLVIKEPHGSLGASLVMEALPESRMILLVRDPRDVVASKLDGHRPGNWQWTKVSAHRSESQLEELREKFDRDEDAVVQSYAEGSLHDISYARKAYEAHGGSKTLVRYEDLRADTFGAMKRIYAEIGIPVDETELAGVVEKHAWENIPKEEKGSGKARRKATPGGWGEDLTEEQIKTVERITAPLLDEFYPESRSGG